MQIASAFGRYFDLGKNNSGCPGRQVSQRGVYNKRRHMSI